VQGPSVVLHGREVSGWLLGEEGPGTALQAAPGLPSLTQQFQVAEKKWFQEVKLIAKEVLQTCQPPSGSTSFKLFQGNSRRAKRRAARGATDCQPALKEHSRLFPGHFIFYFFFKG